MHTYRASASLATCNHEFIQQLQQNAARGLSRENFYHSASSCFGWTRLRRQKHVIIEAIAEMRAYSISIKTNNKSNSLCVSKAFVAFTAQNFNS